MKSRLIRCHYQSDRRDECEIARLQGHYRFRAVAADQDYEYQAAEKLVSAASAIATEPVAIQLRYLQTLTEIGVGQNTTVVFPIPVQMLETLIGTKDREKAEIPASRQHEPVAVSRDDVR